MLTRLSVVLKTAMEWGVIERVPCSIRLLRAPKSAATFYDFDEYERLVETARTEPQAYLAVLLGGEAGLRCGEIMALEWPDVDLHKRQLCVARSEWKGHVTMPKGGRLRYVPLTKRLTDALRDRRHLRGARVLCDAEGKPRTQKVVQVMLRRAARRANVKPGVHNPQISPSSTTVEGRALEIAERGDGVGVCATAIIPPTASDVITPYTRAGFTRIPPSADAELPANRCEAAIFPERIVARVDLDGDQIESAIVRCFREPFEAEVQIAEPEVDPRELERRDVTLVGERLELS